MNGQYRNIVIAAFIIVFSVFKLSTLIFDSAKNQNLAPEAPASVQGTHSAIDFRTSENNQRNIKKDNRRQWNAYKNTNSKNLFKVAKEKKWKKRLEQMKKEHQKRKQDKNKKAAKKAKVVKKGKTKAKKKKKDKAPIFVAEKDELQESEAEKDFFDDSGFNEDAQTPAINVFDNLEDQEDLPKDFAHWEDKLLRFPNKKALRELLQFYSVKVVSQQVFYQLMTALLEDSREEMKFIGLLGLSATKSITSFTMLTDFTKESSVSADLLGKAKKYIEAYNNKNQIYVLRSVLVSSKNVLALYSAARFIENIARQDLARGAQQKDSGLEPLNDGEKQITVQPLGTKDALFYDSLLADINTVAALNKNTQVADQLENAAQVIKEVIAKARVALDESQRDSSEGIVQ